MRIWQPHWGARGGAAWDLPPTSSACWNGIQSPKHSETIKPRCEAGEKVHKSLITDHPTTSSYISFSLFPLLWKFKYKIHLRAICQGELDIGRIKFLKVFPDMAEYLCTVSDKTMTVFFDVRLNILILTPYFLSELLCTGALWPRFVVSHISDWLHCNPNQPKSQSKELERVCSCHWNCRLPALCELTQHFIRLHCASLPQTLISRFYLKI